MNNEKWEEISKRIEEYLAEKQRKDLEPYIRARERLPYEVAVFLLTSGYIIDTFVSWKRGVLQCLAVFVVPTAGGLWVVTVKDAAEESEDILEIGGRVDRFLFLGQFVILGIAFVLSWMNSDFWSASRDILILLAIAYIGTATLFFLIRTGLF